MPTFRKSIFDTLRTILRRGFTQAEVTAIDAALDHAGIAVPNPVPCGPSHRKPATVSPTGIALIKRFEGCARLRPDGLVEAYPDPASGGEPWTIGWGATGLDLDGKRRIGPGTVWTQDDCDARLAADLKRYTADVVRAIGDAPTTQTQFDAMVSFHYNTGAIARATLTAKHIVGDHAGAGLEFARWNKAAGRVLKGLVRRRAAEAALYARQ
jgi:GH24 family phage-related lysozyme (muramidase)